MWITNANNVASGHVTHYILVDAASGNIAYSSASLPFTAIEIGSYIAYTVNYSSTLAPPTLTVGTPLASIGGGCVDLSNPLEIGVCVPVNCSNNISVVITGNNTGLTTTYVLTDKNGVILQSQATGSFMGLANGIYNVYAVNYDPTAMPIPSLTVGSNISSVSGSCVEVSCPVGAIINVPATPNIVSSGNLANVCPATSVDITTLESNPISGTTLEWHTTNSAPSVGTLVGAPTQVTTSGNYYLYAVSAAGCYSPASDAVSVTITAPCNRLPVGVYDMA
jgi:hypothetical protein